MIESLPKGITIGTMQAPLSWIFTHTSRFIGIVRIKIQEGNGVILIEKGKPRALYFQHGQRILRGNAARDYFNGQPLIDFSLDKLTDEEFKSALAMTGSDLSQEHKEDEMGVPVAKKTPQSSPIQEAPLQPSQQTPTPPPEPEIIHGREDVEGIIQPSQPDSAVESGSETVQEDCLKKPIPEKTTPRPVKDPEEPATVRKQEDSDSFDIYETPPTVKQQLPDNKPPMSKTYNPPVTQFQEIYPEDGIPDTDLRMISQLLLGRIKAVPGVVAVLVFNKDTHLLSIGDVNLNNLVSSAEDMLMTVNQLDSVMEWGSFVQMTIQVPTGHVIIAPFFDEYLCILTSPEINLGRIRRILREIKVQQSR